MVARSSIPDPRPMPRLSWALLAGAASIGALSALYVALAPAGDQTPLMDRAWSEVVVSDPEVAGIVARLLVVLGLLGFGFGTLALLVVLGPYRRAERWAWVVLWMVPATYAAIAARQLADGYPIAWLYLTLAVACVVGLLAGRSATRSA